MNNLENCIFLSSYVNDENKVSLEFFKQENGDIHVDIHQYGQESTLIMDRDMQKSFFNMISSNLIK